ncbi:MAG: hypothetical protein U0T83_06810 [Bacteriovoracaceae bacterium]
MERRCTKFKSLQWSSGGVSGIKKQPGSNAVKVAKPVKERITS